MSGIDTRFILNNSPGFSTATWRPNRGQVKAARRNEPAATWNTHVGWFDRRFGRLIKSSSASSFKIRSRPTCAAKTLFRCNKPARVPEILATPRICAGISRMVIKSFTKNCLITSLIISKNRGQIGSRQMKGKFLTTTSATVIAVKLAVAWNISIAPVSNHRKFAIQFISLAGTLKLRNRNYFHSRTRTCTSIRT